MRPSLFHNREDSAITEPPAVIKGRKRPTHGDGFSLICVVMSGIILNLNQVA